MPWGVSAARQPELRPAWFSFTSPTDVLLSTAPGRPQDPTRAEGQSLTRGWASPQREGFRVPPHGEEGHKAAPALARAAVWSVPFPSPQVSCPQTSTTSGLTTLRTPTPWPSGGNAVKHWPVSRLSCLAGGLGTRLSSLRTSLSRGWPVAAPLPRPRRPREAEGGSTSQEGSPPCAPWDVCTISPLETSKAGGSRSQLQR